VLLQLHPIKELLGKDDAGGSADGTEFEFHAKSICPYLL
jgi:hypothetical protein